MTPEAVYRYALSQHRLGQVHFRKHGDMEMACPACKALKKFAINVFNGRHSCFACRSMNGTIVGIIYQHRAEWAGVRRAAGGRDRSHITRGQEYISFPLWRVGGTPGPLDSSEDAGQPLPGLIRRVYDYCTGRGMTHDQITRYKVCARPFTMRAFFPVWDVTGSLVFYMARSINNKEPKTLEPGTEKPLYGLHVYRPSAGAVINVVEGVFDHFATPSSLASMGSAVSDSQITQLRTLKPAWVNLIWDQDAIEKARQVVGDLWRAGIRAQAVEMPEMADPADLGYLKMGQLVRQIEAHGCPQSNRSLRVRL